jgi:hypothetical protein
MTFIVDEDTVKKLTHAVLEEDQILTNIAFHVRESGAIEVWFHFREVLQGGYSAPSYEIRTINPTCSQG